MKFVTPTQHSCCVPSDTVCQSVTSVHAHFICTVETQSYFDETSPHCQNWPWRLQTTVFTWQAGSWWCITTPSLVTKSSGVQKILSGWTHGCDLDLEEQSNLFTKHSSLWWCTNKLSVVAKGSVKKYCRNSLILIIWAVTVTLISKIGNQSFCTTLQFVMA